MAQTLEVGGTVLARPLRAFHVFLFLREFGNVPHTIFRDGVEVRFDLLGLQYRTPVRVEGKSSQKFVRVPVRTFVSRVVFSRSVEAIGTTTKKPGHVDVWHQVGRPSGQFTSDRNRSQITAREQ